MPAKTTFSLFEQLLTLIFCLAYLKSLFKSKVFLVCSQWFKSQFVLLQFTDAPFRPKCRWPIASSIPMDFPVSPQVVPINWVWGLSPVEEFFPGCPQGKFFNFLPLIKHDTKEHPPFASMTRPSFTSGRISQLAHRFLVFLIYLSYFSFFFMMFSYSS